MKELFESYKDAVNAYLAEAFPPRGVGEDRIREAMNYSLLAPGKRIRPVLCLAFCVLAGGKPEDAMPYAAAVEMVHAYSLIHDDLPAMDDDDLRRGRPTNHVIYGEATAILAGDGLLTAAFETALKPDTATAAKCARLLAEAAGERGMVAGQVLDMLGEGHSLTEPELRKLCLLKTGELIRAACMMGVLAGGGSEELLARAERYGKNLGLAFQIRDDILDIESTAEELGKNIGSDAENEKCTFVTLLGADRCRELVNEYSLDAESAVKVPGGEFLFWLCRELAGRRK